MTRCCVVLMVAVAVAACAVGPQGEDSPYSVIPVGSRLILKRQLTVPFDRVSVALSSAGDPPAAVMQQQHNTVCHLDMRKRAPQSRTIAPDEFVVTRVQSDYTYVSLTPQRLAALSTAAADAGPPTYEIRSVTLYVRSDHQPDVYLVGCQYTDTFGEAYPLGVATIRWALGGDFELVLSEKP